MSEDKFDFKRNALVVHGEPTFEECAEYIEKIDKIYEQTNAIFLWAWGDALNFCMNRWPTYYSQLLNKKHYADGSRRNAMWVCRAVPPQNRRLDKLSFHHHRMVAGLPVEKQPEVLQKAIDEELSVAELRRFVKGDADYRKPLRLTAGKVGWEEWWAENKEKLEQMQSDEEAYRYCFDAGMRNK